jgi:signal transduction histidine kinase
MRSSIGSAARDSWLSIGLQVLALEAFLLTVGTFSWRFHPGSHAPGLLGYGLLVVAGGTILLSRRWPVGSVGLALGLVLGSHLLGFAASPIDLALMVALFKAASSQHPWRTVALGAVTIFGYLVLQLVTTGTVALNAFFIGSLTVAAFLAVGYAVDLQRAFSKQRREEETQRRVVEERLRIARELHDVVSHSISTINVQAGVAAHVIDSNPEQARGALVSIKETSRETLRELRGILNVLRQVDEIEPRKPAPGLAQLEVLVETAREAGIPTATSIIGSKRPLPAAVDLAAYRIIQESLTNVIRHAGRASAAVSVDYQPDRVLIVVSDDGRGPLVPMQGDGWPPGHGLAGMRERAAAVNGELNVGPRGGHGFEVRASLPTNGVVS